MERRGIYRKGSAGHVRNASPYRIAREHFKKWRFPLTAVFALVIVFGMAPAVGDNFQASLLTADETVSVLKENPAEARKIMVEHMHSFVYDCKRFAMDDCALEGRGLVQQLSDERKNPLDLLPALVAFENSFEKERAANACTYDLGKTLADIEDAAQKFGVFFENYGEVFDSEKAHEQFDVFRSSVSGLKTFVQSCKTR